MKLRRMLWWVALLVCCALAYFSVSCNAPGQGKLVDKTGKPVSNAFVFYAYHAGAKLIWPLSHYDGAFFTRTDQDGRFRIPLRAHLRFPFVRLIAPVRIEAGVYAPELHNSCVLYLDLAYTDSYCLKLVSSQTNERVYEVRDLKAEPFARFQTSWLLIYGFALPQGPAEQRRELAAAARKEYEEFLAEYGDVIFDNPPNAWPHIPVSDWTRESGEHRPWRFFLQQVPFYGMTMGERLLQFEKQTNSK